MEKFAMSPLIKFLTTTSLFLFVYTIDVFSQDNIYMEKTTKTNTAGVVIEKFEKIHISEQNEVRYITEKRNISLMGNNQTEETKSVVIKDKEWIITYDPDKKTGTKIKNTFTDRFSGMSESDMKKFAGKMEDATNTKVTEEGTEVVAGKSCKVSKAVTNMMGMSTTTTTWMYKTHVLKMESEGMGTTVKELVILFKEGVKFNLDDHKIPSDVEITEVNSPY
jgi:hypothetical protein